MKDFDLEERVNRAVQNFEAGYNCAQSVFLAYSDIFELDMETAKKMSVSFGGGCRSYARNLRNSQCNGYVSGIQISGSGHFRSGSPHQELCNGTENG